MAVVPDYGLGACLRGWNDRLLSCILRRGRTIVTTGLLQFRRGRAFKRLAALQRTRPPKGRSEEQAAAANPAIRDHKVRRDVCFPKA
ncbi:hypothetical protein VTH82DRAFT_2682 [Thermothelomyces myriococcoides]